MNTSVTPMRIRTTLLAFAFILCSLLPKGYAQSYNFSGFNYQAVVRDAGGQPLPNQAVGLQFQIYQGLPTFVGGYWETHDVVTDANGLIHVKLGGGTPEAFSVPPTFAEIDWDAGYKWCNIFMDITGGTNYTFVGRNDFWAVPYALRSLKSDSALFAPGWALNGADLSNTNSGHIGLGTIAPEAALDVHSGNIRVTGSGLTAGLDLTPFSPGGNDPGARVQATDDGGFGAHLDFLVKPIGNITNTLENRMRIESNGNVGIGTATPESILQVGSYGGAVDRYITVASQGGNTQRSGIKLRHFNTSYGYTVESDERIASEGFHILEHFANPAGTSVLYIQKFSGNVGIGTTTPQSKLAVNGRITCKEVEVSLVGFPDYVFAKDYRLMPLAEVSQYIAINGHLPNVPSACEVEENGLGLGELNKILLEKVEELTLHLIEKDQEVDALQSEMRQLRGMILELHAK